MIPVYLALACASALGLVASLALSIANLVGMDLVAVQPVSIYVTKGVFAIWLPFVIMANQVTKDTVRRDFWSKIMEGGAPWFASAVTYTIGFVLILMFISYFFSPASANRQRINAAMGPTGTAGFYAIALMGYYAQLSRERKRQREEKK